MNELTNIFELFSLRNDKNEYINYDYFDFFKNPNKLPINCVFLERKRCELDRGSLNEWEVVSSKNKHKCVTTKKEVIPALHESWVPEFLPTFEYQEYNFNVPEEENLWFLENNRNYILLLEYLIKCTYHQFWCSVLFREEVQNSLRDFMLNPIPIYLYKELREDFQKVYKTVFNAFYVVARRLIFCKESESEYMPKPIAAKYLIERKLLNLPIAVTITLLYQEFDNDLIDELGELYFTSEGQEKFIEKEVENILKHFLVVFEMIKVRITGKFDPGITVVPISLEERPKLFSLPWVDSVLNYLLNMVCTLSALFRLRKSTIKMALSLNVPEKLAKNYDIIFNEVYDLLENREMVEEERNFYSKVICKIGLIRSNLVDTFHAFITYLLDETICRHGNPKSQQEYLESFIDTLITALEYEIFICDYNFKYNLSQTIEMFEDFSNIDKTRTEYILTSLRNLDRHNFLKEKFSFDSAFFNHVPQPVVVEKSQTFQEEATSLKIQQEALEKKISSILGIFPHLGDGFIEKCLEHYDFDTDQVVQAILEENLPPHLIDIPFDFPRIPVESESPKPVLCYRGKKPGYDDALTMLNDKTEKDKMKTLVLEGINYNNRYTNSDDEYDDRDDLLEPEFVVEHEVEKYEKRNEDELVSDTSYSENEYDDDGKAVDKAIGFKPFCEDPAAVRARYEARLGARRGKSNVVGKPKGQGQEKSVVNARQKKNVQKSSRANHNRKGGAQFKRNRGMMPS